MSNIIPLHRGVRRIPFEHMAHHDPDAVYCRGLSPVEVAYLERDLAPIRAQNELRRFQERKRKLNKAVAVLLGIAWVTALFFLLQLGRGVL